MTVEEALRGVTLEAAHSLKMEDEIGSIEPDKRANLTGLDRKPMNVEPMELLDIRVRGMVIQGRVLPAGKEQRDAGLAPLPPGAVGSRSGIGLASPEHALRVVHAHP